MLELRQVLGVRDERDPPVAPLRGLAHLDDLDAVRSCGQLAEVAERVIITGQVEVGAWCVAKHGFRRRRLRECACHQSRDRDGAGSQGAFEYRRPHGTTASLYCSIKSSSLDVLKSWVRRSTTNFRICAVYAASP